MASATLRLPSPLLLIVALLACDQRGAQPVHKPSARSAQPDTVWYREARVLDLTGDGRPDSIILAANGRRSDSLVIVLVLLVDGREAYRLTWPSGDELVDPQLPDTTQTSVDAYVRRRLGQILRGVRTEPLDTASLLELGDSAALRGLQPLPTQDVVFAYGYESTLWLGWDARAKRFVELRYSD